MPNASATWSRSCRPTPRTSSCRCTRTTATKSPRREKRMSYKPLFEPPEQQPALTLDDHRRGDLRDGAVYVYDPDIRIAVNVALATDRPLLISGPAGSG